MWDYIICAIFWVVFIFGIYAFGNVLIPSKEEQSVKFVAGYLVYIFCCNWRHFSSTLKFKMVIICNLHEYSFSDYHSNNIL